MNQSPTSQILDQWLIDNSDYTTAKTADFEALDPPGYHTIETQIRASIHDLLEINFAADPETAQSQFNQVRGAVVTLSPKKSQTRKWLLSLLTSLEPELPEPPLQTGIDGHHQNAELLQRKKQINFRILDAFEEKTLSEALAIVRNTLNNPETVRYIDNYVFDSICNKTAIAFQNSEDQLIERFREEINDIFNHLNAFLNNFRGRLDCRMITSAIFFHSIFQSFPQSGILFDHIRRRSKEPERITNMTAICYRAIAVHKISDPDQVEWYLDYLNSDIEQFTGTWTLKSVAIVCTVLEKKQNSHPTQMLMLNLGDKLADLEINQLNADTICSIATSIAQFEDSVERELLLDVYCDKLAECNERLSIKNVLYILHGFAKFIDRALARGINITIQKHLDQHDHKPNYGRLYDPIALKKYCSLYGLDLPPAHEKAYQDIIKKPPAHYGAPTEDYYFPLIQNYFPQGTVIQRTHFIDGNELDFYLPQYKLNIEIDGFDHDSDRDKIRDQYLYNAHGVTVERITYQQSVTLRLEQILTQLGLTPPDISPSID